MAIGRKKPTPRQALIASAAQVDLAMGPMWPQIVPLDNAWQNELWRLYDCVPEFAKGAGYVGSCCSRVRIYVAEVDDRGEVQKEVAATNPIGRLAYTVLGGPQKQAELLGLTGIAQMVSGEYWILGLSVADAEEDRWFVVQFNELRQMEDFLAYPGAQPQRQFAYNTGRKEYILQEGRDIIFRVWRPHPRYTISADSPGRTLQMTLIELEILTQYILAQARSRLASGGVWIWPSGAEFPADDTQPVNAESVMQKMLDAAKENLSTGGMGSASQVMPMLVELPDSLFDRIKEPIMFGSQLSETAAKLRDECRKTIANGMDVAPEIISGMGDSTHWNGPMIEQSTVDNVIKPIMTRTCNALTEFYLAPALIRGGKNPKKYKFWFDTAALVTRPNRLKETLDMYAQGIVSADEVLKAADLPDSARMTTDEDVRTFARKLLISDTNLIQIPELRKLAGLPIKDIAPDGTPPGQVGAQPGIAGRPPAPPPPERTIKNYNPDQQPQRSTLPGAPNNATTGPGNNQPAALTAAMDIGLMTLSDGQVRQALERVGKTLKNRPGGAKFKALPYDEVYLSATIESPEYARALLASSFGHIEPMMRDGKLPGAAHLVREVLTSYCVDLINGQLAHDVRAMRARLERAGLL
jgi:hypothetical protein